MTTDIRQTGPVYVSPSAIPKRTMGDWYWTCRECAPAEVGGWGSLEGVTYVANLHGKTDHPELMPDHEHAICQHADCAVQVCMTDDQTGEPCDGQAVMCVHREPVCSDEHGRDTYVNGGCNGCRETWQDVTG